ncbi:MAG: hypothetical protein JO362_15885, partial [Streptomycetaceae bacterium]|nr:hypothetical protein [Streptomycetaceae bacterium]
MSDAREQAEWAAAAEQGRPRSVGAGGEANQEEVSDAREQAEWAAGRDIRRWCGGANGATAMAPVSRRAGKPMVADRPRRMLVRACALPMGAVLLAGCASMP